ncbi:MAG: hypothetical protein K2O31_04960 [Clostridia bacterium]|nr:hypothetical protein [Clostridia bacterium]MDE7209214.1 hypothetical protein [Clostridia bacterium]
MQKMLIQLDVEKIERDNKYDIKDMWKAIDEIFAKQKCVKEVNEDGSAMYLGNPNTDNYLADFGIAYITLKSSSWFLEYALKWIWYDNDEDENGSFEESDTLYRVKKKLGMI